MHERDGNRPFAHSGRHAFHIATAHIADGEDAGSTRFEQVRRARQRPFRGSQFVGPEIRAGFEKPLVVERETRVASDSSDEVAHGKGKKGTSRLGIQ